MVERQHGSVIFMASMTSIIGQPKVVAYSAAKSAYLGIVRTLSSELSASGSAGKRDRTRLDRQSDAAPRPGRRRGSEAPHPDPHSHGPLRPPGGHRVGGRVPVLPAAQFITGVLLPVDGGASIGF